MSHKDINRCLSNTEATEEVRIVVENILRYHPNPFHVTDKEAFFLKVDNLLERTGDISIPQQFFGLASLASLIFDTHTQIHIIKDTPGFDTSYPLRFKIFGDGLYIIAGSEAYRQAVGKKVVSISGHASDAVLNKLAEHAFSDSWPRKRVFSEIFLYMPETYDFFDLKTAQGNVEIVLQNLTGKNFLFELSETWPKSYADFSWDRLNPFIPEGLLTVHDVFGTEVPFYQQHIGNNYWFQFLDDESKIMYVQINKQFDRDDKHSLEFHLEWTRALWDSDAERVIVDMRNDPGGNTTVGSVMPKFLENMFFTRPNLQGVAVLMGLDTVSAGTILIAELEDAVWPIMIGEPTGSAPNMYLNPLKMVLPYSRLQHEVSRRVYISVHETDPRAYIAPDIPMTLSFDDYANGRDPLLETAKTVDRELMEKMYQGAHYLAPWKRKSQEQAIR